MAYEPGYEDEYYFKKFFKTNAETSAQMYRETVGFGRGPAWSILLENDIHPYNVTQYGTDR